MAGVIREKAMPEPYQMMNRVRTTRRRPRHRPSLYPTPDPAASTFPRAGCQVTTPPGPAIIDGVVPDGSRTPRATPSPCQVAPGGEAGTGLPADSAAVVTPRAEDRS